MQPPPPLYPPPKQLLAKQLPSWPAECGAPLSIEQRADVRQLQTGTPNLPPMPALTQAAPGERPQLQDPANSEGGEQQPVGQCIEEPLGELPSLPEAQLRALGMVHPGEELSQSAPLMLTGHSSSGDGASSGSSHRSRAAPLHAGAAVSQPQLAASDGGELPVEPAAARGSCRGRSGMGRRAAAASQHGFDQKHGGLGEEMIKRWAGGWPEATDHVRQEEIGALPACSGGDASGGFCSGGGSSSSSGGRSGLSAAEGHAPEAASLVEALLHELRCHLVSAGVRLENPHEAVLKAARMLQQEASAERSHDQDSLVTSAKEPLVSDPSSAERGQSRAPAPSPGSGVALCCGPRLGLRGLLSGRHRGSSCLGPAVDEAEVVLSKPEPAAAIAGNVWLDSKEWLKFCKVLDLSPLQAEQLFIVLGGEELGSVDLWTMFAVLHATVPPEASEASPVRFVSGLLQRFGSLQHAFRAVCSHPERGILWPEFHALADVVSIGDAGALIMWDILVAAEQCLQDSPVDSDVLDCSVGEDIFIEHLSSCVVDTQTQTEARNHRENDELCLRLESIFAGVSSTPRPASGKLLCGRDSTPLLWHQLHALEAIPTPCRQWGTPFATPNGRRGASPFPQQCHSASRSPSRTPLREAMGETTTLPSAAAGLRRVAEGTPKRRRSLSHTFTQLSQVLGTTRAIWHGAGAWMRRINGQPGVA